MSIRLNAFVPIAATALGLGLTAQDPQYSEWSTAANVGSPLNTAAAEGCPYIAKDDLTLYLASTRADGYGGQDIYVSHRDSIHDAWGPAQNLGPTINSSANDLCPTLAIDGHHLFFVSERVGGYGKQDLYVARRRTKRDDFGWESPVNLGGGVNSSGHDFTPTVFEDEATGQVILYFGSDRPGGLGSVDIYSSLLGADGTFEAAILVAELSTPSIDERPFVRKDGLELLFNSDRPGSLGSTDLWVATRENTAELWSTPVNLGAGVNSASAEVRPSLSFDGLTLYFNSNRPGGAGSSDIYVAYRTRVREPE